MSFPRYPKYKDSGVEWLGEVPAGWTVCAVRRILGGIEQGWSPDCLGRPATPEEWGVLKAGCVNRGVYSEAENKALPDELSPVPEYEVRAGDVLMSRASGSPELVGSTALVTTTRPKLMLSDKVFRLRLDAVISPTFFVAALNSRILRAQIERAISGADGLANNLPQSALRSFLIAVPPAPEQRAIAAFLDHETARIDALVAEQERLIELLREKRQAVISRAVTKGLDPNVPMKDSGVEWLGEVPAHWTVAPVGARYSVQLGKMLDASRITGLHLRPYLRVFDVQWGTIHTSELPTMDFDEDARQRYRLLPGDLLVNEGGSYPGRCAIWKGDVDECYYQKALHRVRPWNRDRDETRFLFSAMYTATELGVFVAGGNEATIEHLPAERLRRYRFPFPPPSEQLQIADYLDAKLPTLDGLIAEAERAITLLQERRAALITAAVTGQIDVRGLASHGAA